ncbi:MAG: lipid A export permease/ATP-binding protein MsbA [Gammaproteobacteria bacterium]|nr:lipid A export permease/ATP-binding protein MsbA [Gammaproteobacteria bacterium]
MNLYRRLLSYVVPYWRTFALALLAMVVLALTEPAIPALLKPLLDGSFVERDLDAVYQIAGLLVVVFIIRGASSYLSALALAWVSGRLVMDLRTRMVDKLLTVPTRYGEAHPSGVLISRITFDANQVMEAGTYVLTVLVKDSLAIIGLLAWMAWIDWQLTLVALFAAPFVAMVVMHFSKRLRSTSTGLQTSMGEVTQVVEEVLGGQKVIRVFGGQDYERRRFRRVANAARLFHLKYISAGSATAPIAQLLASLALAAVIVMAAQHAAEGTLTVGGFVSFFTAMAAIFSPLKRLTNVNSRLQKGLAAAKSVFAMIDEISEADNGTRTLDKPRGHVELKDVSFVYPDSDEVVLNNVNLTVTPGETVALVGPSGGGKTTLTHLIPRFHEASEGRVLLDGVDVRELTLQSLREQIALVSQEIVLFDDTVAANIAYGRRETTPQAEIIAAAESAHAMDFIRSLPQGLETRIGENGVRLSGGQRQRIAVARAFLKRAPVLIMDEATSALDNVSERHVQEALDALRNGRTTLIVAHRLSTVERADRILVMAEGQIVEQGTHVELLERSSLYAGLYHFQFSREQDAQSG